MQIDLAQAYRRYFPLLVRKCARMLGDGHEAEDVAQETFLRFARADLACDDVRTVTAWLYRTSTRLALDRLRARKRTVFECSPAALAVLAAGTDPTPELALYLQALLSELSRAAPRAELEAALLNRVDGLTQLEIAEVMRIHERSVRRLLVRFEQRLEQIRARSEA